MSRYDDLRTTSGRLRTKLFILNLAPSTVTVLFGNWLFRGFRPLALLLLANLAALICLYYLYKLLWKRMSSRYLNMSLELDMAEAEIGRLGQAVQKLHDKYPTRDKGEQFKKAYELHGRSIAEFEAALAVGMKREQKEVFVTAFVKQDVVVRVTASIGSPFRCSAADDPLRWKDHIERLGCDSIRQYHNHPVNQNSTGPSRQDYSTSGKIKHYLGEHADKLKSFIVYWNQIHEWRIIEHDEKHFWQSHELDIAEKFGQAHSVIDTNAPRQQLFQQQRQDSIKSKKLKCTEAIRKVEVGSCGHKVAVERKKSSGGSCREANKTSQPLLLPRPDVQPHRAEHEVKGQLVGFPDRSVNEIILKASHIVSAGYNHSTRTLFLKFSGNVVYRYFGVPQHTFDAFLQAPSHGKFAHQNIFPRYRQERC